MMKRIVIIGPESTGKSTLCRQLADHYGTVWCAEYARNYLLQHGTNYTYDDLDKIARGQLALQAEVEQSAKSNLYFIDTDMYVMKVWNEVAFEACPTWILKTLAQTSCDLYLLCNTDLPWEKDELREYPDLATRQRLFHTYKDIVINSGTPWTIISGNNDERLHAAIAAVDAISKNTNA
ncbi:MAG TPA: ATP-binding protein [Flavisolibacter sp.]|nr:ATP-binding protein [Flavisolibacter sp.]